MAGRPKKLRRPETIPPWVVSPAGIREILHRGEAVIEAGAAGIACLNEITAELRKPDPRWDVIKDAIRGAQRTSPRHFRYQFTRLEARLSRLFTERKREQAKGSRQSDD